MASLVVSANILGALLLGLIVGYERSYHGRAAGMRTYGLVCMASAALVVIAGYPGYWYGGTGEGGFQAGDTTRVIQGVVTGVGFLGAGVIMKEGMTISGLTTAASIWASCAIGILVGIGFYPSAILLALLSAASMMWISRLESWLPSRQAVAVSLRFQPGFVPQEETLKRFTLDNGYELATGSISIHHDHGQSEWRFVIVALDKKSAAPLPAFANGVASLEGIDSVNLSHARN